METVLGAARIFLAFSGLVTFYLDPTTPVRYAPLAYSLLAAYAFYSLLVLLFTHLRPAWVLKLRVAVHGVDILWPVALTSFTAETSSPFFVVSTFALLAAAYRWGFLETVATAGVSIVLFFGQAVIKTGGWAASPFSPAGEFELDRFFMRGVFLLIMGYLVGYLGEEEKLLRDETTVVAKTVARAGGEVTLRGAVNVFFEELFRLFGAGTLLMAVRQTNTGRTFLWESRKDSGLASVQFRELGLGERDLFFFDSPSPVWEARCHTDGARPEVSVLEKDSGRMVSAGWAPLRTFTERHPFRYLLVVPAMFGEEWDGRLMLFDPRVRSRGGRTPRLLAHLARQVAPAVYSVYLLGRMRSRAGAMERARVARELHDGVIQALIGLEMHLDVLRRQAAGQALEPELEKLQRNLRREVLSVRDLMREMRPPDLSSKQLLDFLAATVEKFRQETGISARFVTPLEDLNLPSRVCTELARIVQEGLANVRKHSRAQNVLVRFDSAAGCWRLLLDDDGCGFEFSGRLTHDELEAGRKGPVIIKERVRAIGGMLTIESYSGRGSRLEITFPQHHGG